MIDEGVELVAGCTRLTAGKLDVYLVELAKQRITLVWCEGPRATRASTCERSPRVGLGGATPKSIDMGLTPTGIVAVTVLVAVLITETAFAI